MSTETKERVKFPKDRAHIPCRVKDIRGIRYGRLTVLEFAGVGSSGRSRWLCQCDCGGTTTTFAACLRSHQQPTRSCGCLQKEAVIAHQRLPIGEAAFNQLVVRYKFNAKQRDISFELSSADIKRLTLLPCSYCGRAPEQFYVTRRSNGGYLYNGIDRIDPAQGYTLENCVPCCKWCNEAKWRLTRDEFLKLVQRIYQHSIAK